MVADQTLWEQIRRGHREAFEEFYRQQLPRLRGFLRLYLGSQTAAEDIAQEAFLHLWEHPDGFDPTRAGLGTYLFTIARRRGADWWRRRSPKVEPASSSPQPQPETCAVIENALANLDPDSRSLLWLREVEGYSYEELSLMLQIPIGTVKSRLFVARQNLRKIWKRR